MLQSMAESILKESLCVMENMKSLVYVEELDEYAGFMNMKSLNIELGFLASNRIVNQNVIQKRIKENEDIYHKTGKFLNFGTAKLIVIREHNDSKFLIVDGQHRLHTMLELKKKYPSENLWINVSIVVKNTEKEANDYLMLFQKQYPPDERLFSVDYTERVKKDTVISLFREMYPDAFKRYDKRQNEIIMGINSKYRRGEVEKPHLSDGIVADLITGTCPIKILANEPIITREIIEKLNMQLGTIIEKKNEKSIQNVGGCYFGLIRDDVHIINAINKM